MSNELPTWLDEALHALIVDQKRSLRELWSAYDALEEQAVGSLGDAPSSQSVVGVRREFASLRLTAAKQRGVSALDARGLFERREQLGYSSAGERVSVAAIFARICLADGHPELERGELND
ncbi:MAG: hypothetical protein RL033_712, partial [Pseudomonadota bacterium]